MTTTRSTSTRPGRPRADSGDRGASSTEYAILVSGIAMVILVAIGLFGLNVLELFETVCTPFSENGC